MSVSPVDLRRCTEAAKRLLEALELPAYQFAVEPRDDLWQLGLEYRADDGGWHSLTLPFDPHELEATLDDDDLRDRLLDAWRDQLSPGEPSESLTREFTNLRP